MNPNVYPTFVDESNISWDKVKGTCGKQTCYYRFFLEIPFNDCPNRSKILCVILKNPSVANKCHPDNTINKVCYVAHNAGYSKVIILNLFPYCSPDAKKLKQFFCDKKRYARKMGKNKTIIAQKIKGNDVVLAWGQLSVLKGKNEQTVYNSAINDIVQICINSANPLFFVHECKCSNGCYSKQCNKKHSLIRYPFHGLRWSKNSALIKY